MNLVAESEERFFFHDDFSCVDHKFFYLLSSNFLKADFKLGNLDFYFF